VIITILKIDDKLKCIPLNQKLDETYSEKQSQSIELLRLHHEVAAFPIFHLGGYELLIFSHHINLILKGYKQSHTIQL